MVNVIPMNDEREHVHAADCWCNPRVTWQDLETGEIYSNGPEIVHNALDCREFAEELTGEGIDEKHNWAVYDSRDES